MKLKIGFAILTSILILLAGCKKDENNPTAPTITAAEEWDFIMDNDSSNHGQATYEKKSDGSVSVKANWNFGQVHCPFENGTITIVDTTISITAEGTATNPDPAIPPAYQKSAFTVNVTGSAYNGKSSGIWSISFPTLGWPSNLQGTFTSTRISGSGVTK